MPHFDKHFTVSEANALIPRLREIFAEIIKLIKEAQPVPKTVDTLEPGRTNGKHHKMALRQSDIRKVLNDLVTEITDHGIVIQDIQRGLIDFPSFIDGEEVFLCYELADGDSISFYHHIDAGYAGRRPLPDDLLL